MGTKLRGFAVCLPVVVTIPACGSEPAMTAKPSEVSQSIRASAIPLAKALSDQLVEATPRASHSTRVEISVSLNPLTTSQPWIRIAPGWQMKAPSNAKDASVAYQTVYVRLPKRSKYTVALPSLQLHRTRSRGFSNNSKLELLDDEKLIAIFKGVEEQSSPPPRKIMQFVTWAITDDVSYSVLRLPNNLTRMGPGTIDQFITAPDLRQVMDLLEEFGHDKEEFALWRDAMDELVAHIEQYEQLCEAGDGRAFIPFSFICRFYPFDAAAEVLVGSFDRHPGKRGTPYRRQAVDTLGIIGGKDELEIIRQKSDYEQDQGLYQKMTKILDAAAAPQK